MGLVVPYTGDASHLYHELLSHNSGILNIIQDRFQREYEVGQSDHL